MRMVDDSVTRHLASPPAPLELPFCASTCGVGMVVSLYQLSSIGAIRHPPRNQIVEGSFLHNNLTALPLAYAALAAVPEGRPRAGISSTFRELRARPFRTVSCVCELVPQRVLAF